ncbi:MAG: 4Fe-4S binding protein [Thermodesulfobacteriota bacterium]
MDKDPYQQLAEAIGAQGSQIIPEIFRSLVDEEEASLLLAAQTPCSAEEISQKTGIAPGRVEEIIGGLFKKGLIFKSRKEGLTRYYRVRHVAQLHDATAVAQDASREFLDLWKRYMASEWPEYSKKIAAFMPQAAIRVLPVNRTIEAGARILAFDDVRTIVEGAASLAVTKCSCRAIDGKCGKPLEVCIQVNRAADYAIERGTGRELGKQEALEMLRMCEEEGLIHVADNRQEVGHVICNCCDDCCMSWPALRAGAGRFVVPSRFQATVDSELCSACESCLDRCYFGAVSMEGDTAMVAPERCMGCGLCAVICPTEAITLKEVRPPEFVPK